MGAYLEDDAGGESSGKAYIFDVTDGSLLHTLDNPNADDTSATDEFGRSVAISGDRAIVGAYLEDDAGGTDSGKAYIFDVTDGSLLFTLDNPNAYGTSEIDNFGDSVAISGNRAIVGASVEEDAGGAASGKAYIFDVTDGSLLFTLDNPNAYGTSEVDNFGASVAISGNRAIVGAPAEDDAGGTSSGKAYIFDVTDGSLLHTLDNPNAYGTSGGDIFGASVAISGDRAIVGAYAEGDAGGSISGKAYIFDVTDGSLLFTLDNPNAYGGSFNDRFGWSVAISGNRAIVGAYQETEAGVGTSGKAYIFDVTSGNLLYTLDNPNAFDTSAGDRFGWSVAISGNRALVGAIDEDSPGPLLSTFSSSGKAYIFNIPKRTATAAFDSPISLALQCPIFTGDKLLFLGYSSQPYVYESRTFDRYSLGAFAFIEDSQITNNYPWQWGMGNGKIMLVPYRPTATTGNIYINDLDQIDNWTKLTGVLPSADGFCLRPVYNPDDGRWVTGLTGSATIYYSDNDGATWSTLTIPGASQIRDIAYGNGVWLFADSDAVSVFSSDDNLASFTETNTASGNIGRVYKIHFNEYDQKFWIGGANFNTRFYPRMNYSVDGVSWINVYNDDDDFAANINVVEIQGDDDGNYIAIGPTYDTAYQPTTEIMKSVDGGETWHKQILPAEITPSFSIPNMAYGSMNQGDTPAGTPLPPSYDVQDNLPADTPEIGEGGTITWTISTAGIPDGSDVYWRINQNPSGEFSQFTDPTYASSVQINNNIATVTKTIVEDQTTEGPMTVSLDVKTGSINGTTVASSRDITILDTSQTPPPPPPPEPTQPVIREGSFEVLTSSIPLSYGLTHDIQFRYILDNATPYTYTVDTKFISANGSTTISSGDVINTYTIDPLTALTVTVTVSSLTGMDYTKTTQDFTFRLDAREATTGTRPRIDISVPRNPYSISISPHPGSVSNGGSYSATYPKESKRNITLTGMEPDAPFFYEGINGTTANFYQFANSSGSYTFSASTLHPNEPPYFEGTLSFRVEFADKRTINWSITYD